MRFVVAPQEFKGSLTAVEAAAAIAAGVRAALPAADIVRLPMSDGGPGLVDAMLAALGGERITSDARDPLMRPRRAQWGLLPDGTAVIEMAAASGLVLLAPEERSPLVTTTYGTGELIRAAVDRGCERVIVGVGGSATVDGGAGALQALGVRLLDADGLELGPGGGALEQLDRIDASKIDDRPATAPIRVASDVRNPLCGPEGAAAMFGPQKGASPQDVRTLDHALRHFAMVIERDLGVNVLRSPGGGAAGGLAAGLAAIGASIELGFAIVADAARLAEQIAAADVVITGEGRLDVQTGYGKTASGVAALARAHGKPVIAIAGSVVGDHAAVEFDFVETLSRPGLPQGEAMSRAGELLREAAESVARRWHAGASD